MKYIKSYFLAAIIIITLQHIAIQALVAQGNTMGTMHYLNPKTTKGVKAMFHYTGDSVCFISSHRGGPDKNFCENSIPTFEHTLEYTYSLMEIDPHYTKDSVLVVMHDPTLQRTSNGKGRIADFTFQQLREIRLKDIDGNVTGNTIHTLEEVLRWAKGRTILVLDKKEVPMANRVRIVQKCKAQAYTFIMAYSFDEAKLAYSMDKNIMMQIFVPTPEKALEFDKSGVPWSNVVAFVSHQLPQDLSVFDMVHQRGALCILGTSRNLDLELERGKVKSIYDLEKGYNSFYRKGADILETDIPVEISKVVAKRLSSPTYRAKFVK